MTSISGLEPTGRELRALQRRDLAMGVPVAAFTGINGAGKTTLAVASAIADMAVGRRVYSTVPITSRWGNSEPVKSLRQLVLLEDCTVLLDDVAVIFSARNTQSLPGELVVFWQTLRHRGLTCRWTAPEWMRADTLVRGVTQGLVNVHPMLRKTSPGDPWPSPRIVAAGLMDTGTGKADAAPTRVLRRRLLVPSRLGVWGTYDTKADTPQLGAHHIGGRCVDCGGSIATPKHSVERHDTLGLPWYGDDPYVVMEQPEDSHVHD